MTKRTVRKNKRPGRTSKKSRKKSPSLSLLSLFPEYRKKEYTLRVSEENEKFRRELQEAYLHKGLVLYVGAGVSRSVGLPSWPELIKSLTVTMMTKKVESAKETLGDIGEEKYLDIIQKNLEDTPDFEKHEKPILMMARAIKDVLKDDLPHTIARTLYHFKFRIWARHKYSSKDRQSKSRWPIRSLPSSKLLDELVSLSRAERDIRGVEAIVNYNYDNIYDEKLREQNVRCKTVLSGSDIVPTGFLPCYHVHGVLPLEMIYNRDKKIDYGNFVFSEDEYHTEYSDPYRWSNMTQISQLGRYTGLLVGLSMEDPNIRRLIDVTHQQYPEVKNYAIIPRKISLKESEDNKDCVLRNLFEEVESRSFEDIGVNVIWVDSYDGIPEFLGSIHT